MATQLGETGEIVKKPDNSLQRHLHQATEI